MELVGRIKEGGGGAVVGAEVGGGFENAGGGGADGDGSGGGGDFFGQAKGDFVFFFVHGVVAKVGSFDGAEGAEADVKSDEGVGELGEEFGGKVETGGGGGDGA